MFTHFLGEMKKLYLLFCLHISATVLTGSCGWCTYTENGWVSSCGKTQSFHNLSVRLMCFFLILGACMLYKCKCVRKLLKLTWFLSVWMILAKQEFEVAYPLATRVTNLWAGSEIHFYLLVLKCCLRKSLQICSVYCFIVTPSCHHPTFPSICLLLSPPCSLHHPKAQKNPKQTNKKTPNQQTHTYGWGYALMTRWKWTRYH